MESIRLAPDNDEVSVEVSIERLHEELGTQGILDGDVDGREFFYLAALSLECHDDDEYDATRVVMEFVRNSSEFEHVTPEAANDIEKLLR